MGDYIDRGAQSREVVDKLIDMQNLCNCIYLIGSHEYAMLNAPRDDYYNYLFGIMVEMPQFKAMEALKTL